jgi:hypothetical protein
MRKRICISLMALSFIVSMAANSPASAKSVEGMRALIPFDFNVGDKLISAGEYAVKSLTDDERALRIGNGKQSAFVMTNSARESGDGRARLVFHKYGDQYFLVAVWGTDGTGRSLIETKRERSLRKEVRAERNRSTAMEVVIVAAQ